MELSVLAREKSFVVIDKPAGLPVEADSRESVVAMLSVQLAPAQGGRAWPRVVHRLDRDTSGCLVVALNQVGEKALLAAFDEGTVEKEYLALVRGAPAAEGKLDTPYGKDPVDRRRYTTRLQTARRARLRWTLVEQLRGAALLRVVLDTGRTHQIRVQLAELGHALLGDATYGLLPEDVALSAAVGLSRQALHSARLSFPNPEGEGTIDCTAPLPPDLSRVREQLRPR